MTVKPFCRCAISPRVVNAIVRKPMLAPAPIEMFTVAVVALDTVTEFTVMSPPKLAVVTPCSKCVSVPVMATLSVCPCSPDAGLRSVRIAMPGVTEKPLPAAATSVPVVIVTLRAPVNAVGSTVTLTVADVGLATVTLFTWTPAPKFAVVAPCTKLVSWPVTLTTSAWPC